MKRTTRHAVIACVTLLIIAAGPAAAATQEAVEYYNATLDHYFVTALPDEIAKLDSGSFVGWQRTNRGFRVLDPATPAEDSVPVCRFYGSPAAGLDSHFYSASAAECEDVRRRFAGVWLPEADNAFGVWLPDPQSGACPAGSIPVYRSWNKRADSNHRFTTDPAVQQAMIAQGYLAEGYGPGAMPVAMCAPSDGQTGPVPACVVSASDATPNVGSQVVLTATCTNAPATFTWTNCTSGTSTCSATSPSIGQLTYTVVARNAAGASAPASIIVAWQSPSTATAKCTLARTSQTESPVVDSTVVLKATCDKAVGSYTWNGCSSTSNVCLARESTPGPHTYSVFARTAAGASEPVAMTLGWVSSAAPPPGLCGQFPSYMWSDVGTQNVRVESYTLINPPGFAWNGAWAVRFVVPATIGTRLGRVSTAEFAGEPTVREATISRTPCDFRPTDPTGANGPFVTTSGISVTNFFTVDPARPGYPVLQAGATYYYNVRNWQPATNTISCPGPGRCDAFVETLLPK
jgi:hypothetical protein